MASQYQIQCGLFGCGEMIDATKKEWDRGYVDYCPNCGNPLWPLEKGFTGNSPQDVREFAETHDYEGNLKI